MKTEMSFDTTPEVQDAAFDESHAPDAEGLAVSLDWESQDGLKAPVAFEGPCRHDQAVLVKTIGARMKEARELCNMSQIAAAKLLGYANPSKLSKVELATDTNSVPLALIRRAAQVYDVSVDFLFGMTDDWEVGAPRSTQAWLLDAWEKARERDLSVLDRLHQGVVVVAGHVAELAAASTGVAQALATWRERNPEFDETRASAPLAARIDRMRGRSIVAEAALKKLRLDPGARAPKA